MNSNLIEKEIDLYNKLNLKHPNIKYIKSKEFTNILLEMVNENINTYIGGDNNEY
ncbi:hypothetical protein [Paraclostridium bifermentans]|uniref:hypothetical protein n=1 Tax=Paraclostridium bifermentans TaxID=1490 RepID=UPI0024314835|nr:hypothetical protein [Paraclostridium bifermentans]